MSERRINWTQIVVTALVTGVVTVITGIILFKLQTREPKLLYEAPDTNPFQGTDRSFAIYNVSISNRGRASIDDILGVIQVPGATLEDFRVSADTSLQYTTSIVSDTFEIRMLQLNPRKTIALSVLATSASELSQSPEVSVRGSGISGVEGSSSTTAGLSGEGFFALVASAVVTAYSGLAFLAFLLFRRRGVSSISIGGLRIPLPFASGGKSPVVAGKHSGDQNQIMAYLCGLHGLLADVQEYLVRPCDTSYWSEADRFATIASADPTSEESEKRKSVLKHLLEYARITSLSQGIICYDIARIALAQGNAEEAREYLVKAQELGEELIQTRLKIEPSLRELQDTRA